MIPPVDLLAHPSQVRHQQKSRLLEGAKLSNYCQVNIAVACRPPSSLVCKCGLWSVTAHKTTVIAMRHF